MDAVRVLELYRDTDADIEYICGRIDDLKRIPEEYHQEETAQLHTRLGVLVEFRAAVNRAIDKLTPEERKLIMLRVRQRRKWASIGIASYYSQRQAQNVYKNMLIKLGKDFEASDIIRRVIDFDLIR